MAAAHRHIAKSILVVDDEPAIRRIVGIALRDLGCETYTAADAETALELLETRRPDVILADVRLPGVDGVELARRVKADAQLSSTPVLLMSAFGEPSKHQGEGFLPKPFDHDELASFLSPYIRRKVRAPRS